MTYRENSPTQGLDSKRHQIEPSGPNIFLQNLALDFHEGLSRPISDYILTETIDEQINFDVDLVDSFANINHPWLQSIEDFMASLCKDPGPTLSEEFSSLCKIGDADSVLTTQEISDLKVNSRRDDFLRRPELLEADIELRPHQLSAKNKIRELF